MYHCRQPATERLQRLTQSKKNQRVDVVRLPDDLYNHWKLTFSMDRKSKQLLFSEQGTGLVIARSRLKVLSEEEIAWEGDILYGADRDKVGDVTLIQDREGAVSGTIDLEGTFYEIRPLGSSGLHGVRQVNMDYVKELSRESDVGMAERSQPVRPDSSQWEPPELPGSAAMQQIRCSPEYQRLLVLNTPAAAQGRDIDGIVSLAVQETNEAYDNSQVYDLEAAVAHQQQINFTETPNINVDLNDLIADATVQNLRNQHNADAVLLLTDGNYDNGTILGSAFEILATQGTAYAIVEADHAAGPDYTFAHELGHLQGGHHHPEDTGLNTEFSYGHGHRFSYKPVFQSRRRRATIMAYRVSPYNPYIYSRVRYFSNPDVEYEGKDTGIADERENWQVLNTTATTLADFRNPNELRTNVIPNGDPNTGLYNISADPCGGQSGYSYEWRISYDNPYSYGGVVGTGPSLIRTFPAGQHFVLVEVTSGTQQASAIAVVWVNESGGGGGGCIFPPCPESQETAAAADPELAQGTEPGTLQLHPARPNPFNPATEISFTLPASQHVKVAVYDLAGREVAVLAQGSLTAGAHRFRFDAANLSSGVYFVRLQTSQMLLTQKITLVK